LQENLLRKDINPVDEASGYLSFYRMAMEDETITPKQIIADLITYERDPQRPERDVAGNLPALCRISGKSTTYLRRLECILTLPENAIEAVKNGKPNKAQAPVFLEDIDDERINAFRPLNNVFTIRLQYILIAQRTLASSLMCWYYRALDGGQVFFLQNPFSLF